MVGSILCSLLYFAPTIVAARRNHPNVVGVFLANLFLGWTGIGWIVMMIWALTLPGPYYYGPYGYPQAPYQASYPPDPQPVQPRSAYSGPYYNPYYGSTYCRTCWRRWW